MNSAQQKQKEALEPPVNAVTNIPAHVSIEVLGNGTCHLRACVALRTPLKTYLFNCPEGTSRFLPQLRMKSLNVNDIFITRATWDNIAGISSIMLSKESNCLPTRIHGAMNIKHFLECIRPFQDTDYGSAKYPSQVEERPYTLESYEDAALNITYLPLSAPLRNGAVSAQITTDSLNVAYLIELKPPPRRIDPLKLIAHKVPKGPLIGKLKSGNTIILPDGRTIQPDDVFSTDTPTVHYSEEKSRALVFECSGEAHIKAIIENSVMQDFLNGTKKLDYIVHLSEESVIHMPLYRNFVDSLAKSCCHIVVNSSCPIVPGIESIFSAITSEAKRLRERLSDQCEYPRVSFLGTSSAVPSKYRNVSGYLLEASSNCAMLVDVGEGTYGQMRVLLGEEKCREVWFHYWILSPGPPTKRRRLPSPVLSACRNVIELMPKELFNEDSWNIQEIKAVQVHHTRMANGFIFGIGGKRIVFSGDTKPCDLLVEEGQNADLLIHEATFEDGHEADALRKKHSTMGQAVEIGRKMKARNVILTHFSARYPKVPELPTYLEKCGNVGVAMDNLRVRFDQLELVPKLLPIFRCAFLKFI
ncbi:unnamed protein product [Angiostrongylus costaricensis]|uniref:ribonuclease Z n=1 Tax=Angiostrongylus costaricensis TaxID=334426 RepID=A0A158PJU1_ANGCS|nr:unnamed protein product [Angiostrongylus costaricensis]